MPANIRRVLWLVALGLALAPSARADPIGSWSALPSMSTARYGAVAAQLDNGEILVAGGLDGSGRATASAEVYDSVTDAWTTVAAMGSARAFAAAAPLPGDCVLVAGGEVNGSPSASAEIYDGLTNTWSAAASMNDAREGAVAAALPDGTVWVAGGGDLDTTESYDPATNAWSISPMYTEARVGSVATPLADGSVFLAGGSDPASSGLISTYELDSPAGNSGTPAYEMAAPPYEASAAETGTGQVLVAGGSASESDPSGSAQAELYDAQEQSWSSMASMATPRYGAAAAQLPDGGVLVAGGEGGSGPLASAEAFSLPTFPPPVNTSPPQIQDLSGSSPVRVGDLISSNPGAWSDEYSPSGYADQWQRCFSTCEAVSAGSIYTVTAADAGATLRLAVIGFGEKGPTATAVSNEIGPVAAAGFHLAPLGSLAPFLFRSDGATIRIPVVRDEATGAGEVSYRIWDPSASPDPWFTPISGVLQFTAGEQAALIDVPAMDHGVAILPNSLEVELYDGSPLSVVSPSDTVITVNDNALELYVRNPLDPLGLPSTPPRGNPLAGAEFFADYSQSRAGRQALAWSASDPWAAAKLMVIARAPNTERFGAWNGLYPGWNVATYLARAAKEEPGTVPMISTYRVVYGHCGHWSDPPSEQAAYHDWARSLAEGIGTHPAVLFLEMDSLITVGCLSPKGVAVRMHELHDAINLLSRDPHLVIYLDAGAADAVPARETARLLRRAGVGEIQGFFVNSTHFDWTSKEIAYGEKISRLTGGKHFVINTADNGQGPLRTRDPAKQGAEVLCDPPGRGLGPLPTADTGYPNVDAFAWIANPGVSGGKCGPGAPPSGVFWPHLALELVRHADFRVR